MRRSFVAAGVRGGGTGVMSVFVWVLGGVTAAVGLLLVASGVAVHDGTFDTDVIIPGTIAAVGGLLLVGMGVVVRELRRIEHALTARPAGRAMRLGETSVAAAAETPEPAVRMPVPPPLPFPPKPKVAPSPQSAPAAMTTPVPAEDTAAESPRAKVPNLPRAENDAAVEAADAPSPARAMARNEEDHLSEVKDATSVGRAANGAGAAGAARVTPRPESKARLQASPPRAKGAVINAFWPAAPRRDAKTVSAQSAAPLPSPPVEPMPIGEAVADVGAPGPEPAAAAPVSVIKSGAVEGIAYTLYSDGSIEAQLAQGTLRFGSIAALLNYIESSS